MKSFPALTKWVRAHLIILLPPLGLLSTAQHLLLNQTSILEVSLLSAEKIMDSVKVKNGNVLAEGSTYSCLEACLWRALC